MKVVDYYFKKERNASMQVKQLIVKKLYGKHYPVNVELTPGAKPLGIHFRLYNKIMSIILLHLSLAVKRFKRLPSTLKLL